MTPIEEAVLQEFKDDSMKFLDNVDNFHFLSGRDEGSLGPIVQFVKAGLFPLEELDRAITMWLATRLSAAELYSRSGGPTSRDLHSVGYKIRDIAFLVDACATLEMGRETLRSLAPRIMAIAVENDGGHWENSLKAMLTKHGWVEAEAAAPST
jgi:hypothetical protein